MNTALLALSAWCTASLPLGMAVGRALAWAGQGDQHALDEDSHFGHAGGLAESARGFDRSSRAPGAHPSGASSLRRGMTRERALSAVSVVAPPSAHRWRGEMELSSPRKDERELSVREIVRLVFKSHAVKRLQILTGRPAPTIKHWLNVHCSEQGTRELLEAAIAEFDRQEQEERAPLRRALERVRRDGDGVAAGAAQSGVDSLEILKTPPVAAPDRPPPRPVGAVKKNAADGPRRERWETANDRDHR